MRCFLALLLAAVPAACLRGGFAPELAGRLDGADGTARDSEARPPDWWVQGERRPECFSGNGCYECQPLHNTKCAEKCPELDCDNLLQPFDPWPEICNSVIFSDGFLDPTLADWLSDHEGEPAGKLSVPSCGRLLFQVQPGITNWMWPRPEIWTQGGAGGRQLTEMRLLPPAGYWSVMFMFATEETGYWRLPYGVHCSCALHRLVPPAGDRLGVEVAVGQNISRLETEVEVPAGAWVRLQSWIAEGKTHCRLLLERGGSMEAVGRVALDAGLTPEGAAPTLVGFNRMSDAPVAFELDWVRVFKAP